MLAKTASVNRPLEAADIRGIWATLMLPINEDESIDFGRLEEEIDRISAFGVDGIYSNGTAGEFYNQSESEFRRIHRLLARRCRAAGLPFQIGVSHMSPWISLSRLKWAIRQEPGAVQLILPDWFPPTEAEIIAFLKKMAAVSADVRLVLYNPGHAKVRLTPEQFGRLKDAVPQLVGVKVAGGDAVWYEQMRKHMADRLAVFVPGHRLATGFRQGAHGSYSNIACLHPQLALDWYRLMQTDLAQALDWEKAIQHFMNDHIIPYILEQKYPDPACDKFLSVVGGWANVGCRMRWPYRSIPEAGAEAVRAAGRIVIPVFSTLVTE
ncbi:dihydrodipicolinate synthase family protein [Larkinella rosea]|uniref:Dihydrodipicolinate synthase family protein n=1 Tax=Larkinella rosea TaxID=2025312 RepID=A0A3P1BAK2_9BACT|nr:dihydrodipicolinate synthase family protein [Larkinella rosea]RRA98024.1 dihydrodipicolinate synthase family protein [Larkinella rosea]